MELTIRLFATLKDRAGKNRVVVSLEEPATVATLKEHVSTAFPGVAPLLPAAITAVNQEFATDETKLQPGDEIAFFPPVSGGDADGFSYPTYFALTSEPVELDDIVAHLTEPEVGAVVLFHGSVRGETHRPGLPSETSFLEYEAYEVMAIRKMRQIAEEIWEQWPQVRGVAIVQRLGRLEVSDTTTLVACAAGHRDQGAFEAARYGIDRLKEIVPVWKKEVSADRSVWIEGHYRPTEQD